MRRGRNREKPHPVDVYVGQRLRERRSVMGISRKELGRLVGVSFQQLQKYEQATNRISASRLFYISRILRVSVGWFFGGMPGDLKESCDKIYPGISQQADRTGSDDTSPFTGQSLTGLFSVPHTLLSWLARLRFSGWLPVPA